MTAQPIVVADADARADWLAQRRTGITATEVAKAATGRPADRRNIITEKVKGETREFDSKWLAWGRAREPFIADWIARNYGIDPNRNLLAHPANPRYLATPDGYNFIAWSGDATIAEVKTSKHDLDPRPLGVRLGEADPVTFEMFDAINDGRASGGQFWSETYYDQMQWQMFVTGAHRCLFVWEQHDDNWPEPRPLGLPRAVWVELNPDRVATLVGVADAFLADIDAARSGSLPWDEGDVPGDLVDPVHRLLEARVLEAAAKAAREAVWGEVQALVKDLPEDEATYENHEAKVTWSTTYRDTEPVYDLADATAAQAAQHVKRETAVEKAAERVARAEAVLARANESFAKAREALVEKSAPFAHVESEATGRRVTVTGKKQGDEK